MHPLRHPRNAIFVGLMFVVVGVIYWVAPYFGNGLVDYAGLTMLVILGIASSIMAYVLIAGSPRS